MFKVKKIGEKRVVVYGFISHFDLVNAQKLQNLCEYYETYEKI